MTTSEKGIKLIKHFESLHDGDLTRIGLQPKLCQSGIYTAGWGHAIVDPKTNKFITKDTPNGYVRACELFKDLTLEQADQLLIDDLRNVEQTVTKLVKLPITQCQFDALVSHVFNCGVSETLFKLVNSVPHDSKELREWWTLRYITGNGIKLNGLIRRRKTEYDLFSTCKLNLNE